MIEKLILRREAQNHKAEFKRPNSKGRIQKTEFKRPKFQRSKSSKGRKAYYRDRKGPKQWAFARTSLTLAHYFDLFNRKLYKSLSFIGFLVKLCHFDYMIHKIFCLKSLFIFGLTLHSANFGFLTLFIWHFLHSALCYDTKLVLWGSVRKAVFTKG